MMFNSFFFILGLIWVSMDSVPGQEQDEQCGGPLSAIEFDDIADGCAYYARCSQPTYKLAADCILSSCPLLGGLCPLNPDKSINNNALTSAVSVLNICIGQNNLICGINMTRTPMVQLGWTTKQLFPQNVANGTMNLNPGTGYLNNLSKTNFTLVQTDSPSVGPISLYIRAPNISNGGSFTCTFNLTSTSFLTSLKRQLTTSVLSNSISTPEVIGYYYSPIDAVVSIDLTTPTPTVHTLQDQSQLNAVFSNFVSSDKEALPPALVTLFNKGMTTILYGSDIISSTINFLSTYAAQGLKGAQLNCPSI